MQSHLTLKNLEIRTSSDLLNQLEPRTDDALQVYVGHNWTTQLTGIVELAEMCNIVVKVITDTHAL